MATHGVRNTEKERGLHVLIVDDHALVRQEIRSMLEGHTDIQIVGEARNGIEAIILVEQLRPSIVLMDINMPKMNGIEATAPDQERVSGHDCHWLSVNATMENQTTMQRAGAVRLIQKEEAAERLYDAIHAAVQSRGNAGATQFHLNEIWASGARSW
jgi:DNA-binding NarL/FixJ family response regulator